MNFRSSSVIDICVLTAINIKIMLYFHCPEKQHLAERFDHNTDYRAHCDLQLLCKSFFDVLHMQ